MSNYDETARKEETKQLAAKSQHSFLSQEERQNLQRMLAHPEDLPKEFKSWLVEYLQVFPPQTPLSQVIGATGTIQAAVDAGVGAHTADATDAHDASAISIADAANDFFAINVEDALAELQAADETDEAALAAHIGDTADAHDASAISFSPHGSIAATDVQAAIQEVRDEAAGGGGTAVDDENLVLHMSVFA